MANEAERALDTWIERMIAQGHPLSTALNSIAYTSGIDQWDANATDDARRQMLLRYFRELETERQ